MLYGTPVVLGANAVSLSPVIELMSGVLTITGLSICNNHSVSSVLADGCAHHDGCGYFASDRNLERLSVWRYLRRPHQLPDDGAAQ